MLPRDLAGMLAVRTPNSSQDLKALSRVRILDTFHLY